MRFVATHWTNTGIEMVGQPAACGQVALLKHGNGKLTTVTSGYLRTTTRPERVTCTKCRKIQARKQVDSL